MLKIKRNRKVNESDPMYFNGYTYDTVPDVPSIGGIPQYNPMIVDDRIELMDEVVNELEDYWYSEDPRLEDKITRVTNRGENLYVKDIYWKLDNPDEVTVKFGLAGFDGSNDRVAETRDIEINFDHFLGRDIEGDLVMFLSEKIKSLLDSVLHGGLYKEGKNMLKIKLESDYDIRYYDGYNKFNVPRVRGNQYNPMIVGEREELFNNILDSIDKKQSSPKYDHIFYIEGTNVDVGGGVEYPGMYNHVDGDYTKVNIICELLDKNSGKTLDSFEKNLIIDYSDFMDSYGIESDIEDYILDELRKYMMRTLKQYDPKYRKFRVKI